MKKKKLRNKQRLEPVLKKELWSSPRPISIA